LKILIAEDDEYFCEALSEGLDRIGYGVDCVHSGLEARGAIADSRYDLLLLDLGLPDIDGIRVLRDIRKDGAELPVIIITARDGLEDKICGLNEGASDYLTKPFDFRELDARIRALLRNSFWRNKTQIKLGSLEVDTGTGEVFLDDTAIQLTPRETATLEHLLRQPGRLVRKGDLIDILAKWDTMPSENAVEIIIHRLRRKLGASDVNIRTARGFGYVLEKRNEALHS
jgi:two-component system OmpR family response regulator